MKTAVIYTRVSTDEQARNGYSLEFQEDVIRKFCAVNDVEVLQHYQEDHSAKSFDRPAFKRMLEYIRRHKRSIDLLLFAKWDRFSRNATDSLNMIRQLDEWGIDPQAVQQPLDLSIPQNKLMLAFYLMEPEVNNDVRSIATREGLRRIRSKGGWTGHAPTGYDLARTAEGTSTMQPNGKAFFIREAFAMIAEGTTQKRVRAFLRANGCASSKNYLLRLLTNETYLGLVFVPEYKKEPARWVQGLHPAIVDGEVFNQVQKRLAGSAAKGRRYKYVPELPLRGNLQCQRCGTPLTGSGSRNKRGNKYYYYHCQHPCTERIPAHEVNESFGRMLAHLKPDPAVLKLYEAVMGDIFQQKQGSSEDRLIQITKEIESLKAKLFRADELYIEGKMPHDRYDHFTTQYKRKVAVLEQEQEEKGELGSNFKTYLNQSFRLVQHLDTFYSTADVETRQQLVCSIFPRKVIYVGDGKYRTPDANQLIALFTGSEADFDEAKSTKAAIFRSFCEICTWSGNRTRTPITGNWILSPTRLPVPPSRQMDE